MRIIEQRDIIEMMGRTHQTLANLRIVSDAVAGAPCDAKTIMAALGVVRVNGERAGRQARRMLRAFEAEARSICGGTGVVSMTEWVGRPTKECPASGGETK